MPTAEPSVPFVLGGRAVGRPSARSVSAIGIILAAIALPLRGLYRATGSSMEEGFMIVFPMRFLAGDVPNVDYLHLYGPASIHVLAGWYWLFGDTLEVQRTFGLLQHVALIAGMYALARAYGHVIAATSALTITVLVITPIGLSALAWEGGVALAVWSVVFAVRAQHSDDRARRNALVAAGALAGLAIGYRPDLVLALGLVHGVLFWRSSRRAPFAAGFGVGLLPLLVHLAMAGPVRAFEGMVLDPVLRLRPGRELPRPPSWSQVDGALQAVAEGPLDAPWWGLPSLSASQQLFVWFFVVILLALALPVVAWRWQRADPRPRTVALLAGSMLSLGMLPQALQRPDSTHLAWGSCVAFALLPCAIADLADRRGWSLRPRLAALLPGAVVALVFLVVCPFFTYRTYLFHTRVTVGNKPGGYEVSRDERRFHFGNEPLQRSAQGVIDDLDRMSEPGQRLLVGPADLARTIYSDVVFYYLFPELDPATYYIEMDPGLADAEGSRLADDVASADWLILTNYWTGWYEPNASIEWGSEAPNQVVADHFCLVGNYENALVLLYRACEVGDGISPAGIGIGADRRADVEREIAERAAR